MQPRSLSALSGAVLGALATACHAQVSGTWINPYGGSWLDPTNWDSNPLYPGGGGVATFSPTKWNSVNVNTGIASIVLSQVTINSPAKYSISGGTLSFAGPAVFDVTGPAAQAPFGSAVINGHSVGRTATNSGLIKNGPGAVRVDLFSVSGGITINGGTLIVGNNTPFGPSPGTLTLNGGCLGVMDLFLPITQSIDVGSAGGIIRTNPGLAISGSIGGSGSLLLQGLSKNGFTLTSANTFSGALTTRGVVRLNANGQLLNVGALTILDSLVLENGGTASSANRLSDTAPITTHGGSIGGTLSAGTETVGTITLAGGLNSVGSLSIAIATPEIVRQNRATLGAGTSILFTSSAPALSGSGAPGTPEVGIVPWARQNFPVSVAPVTVDPAGQMRALNSSEYLTTLPAGASAANVQLSSDTAVAAPTTVNSLQIYNSGLASVTVSGSTLSISSGAVYLQRLGGTASPQTTIAAPLDFGSAEGIIHSIFPAGTEKYEISGPIGGTNGLTIAGAATLSGASTYTGPTNIHGRVSIGTNVLVSAAGPLGMDASPVVIEATPNGAGITFITNALADVQFHRDVIIRNPGLGAVSLNTTQGVAGSPGAIISGDIDFEGILSLNGNTGSASLIVTGDLSGPGNIRTSSGIVLSGNNSFTGGLEAQGGFIGAGSDTAFGSGTLWFGDLPSIYAHGAARTLANPVVIQFSLNVRGDQELTLSGPVDLFGGLRTIICNNTATTTLSGEVFDGGLQKQGAGLLQMARVGLPTLTISSGPMRIIPNGTDAATSFVRALTIAPTSATNYLDLADNDLVIDYTGATVAPTIRAMLIDHRLRSSFANATLALGYADNAALGLTSFSGLAVDSTTVLVKYTFLGDSNLDGQVDITDLGNLATNWQAAGDWLGGDFNFDGTVDITDLGLLASNWQQGVGSPLRPSLNEALASMALGSGSVPEPSMVCIAVVLAGAFARTRRCG